ncbi:MAG: 2-oxoglutarate dehydrogenase complex dihydrolipoyllysine-residue succinyltransferase [Bdellovibrionales bacterium]|nr:2-oxoglutarate dehydrogenase complex dihydrolipoyllysine-residue succinyltransferase [Bdellovibrionales bacterium]
MKIEIKVPAVGESITEATISEWKKKNGETVKRDDVLLVLETDKASVEVVAESDGVLATKVQEGETVQIGSIIGTIDTEGSPRSDSTQTGKTTSSAAPSPAGPTPAAANGNGNGNGHRSSAGNPSSPHLSPAVRKIVSEKGIDSASLGSGSGKGGRLTKGDVLEVAQTGHPGKMDATLSERTSTQSTLAAPLPLPQSKAKASGDVKRVPMSKLRQTIARRLVEAQHTAAILTTFNEIDMTAVMALRAKYKDSFKEKHGVSLGFMGFFVKATVAALKAFPQVNSEIEGTSVLYKDFINMGIAVSTEKGLLVPVIRDADQLSIAEIELAIRHYALKARDGKISLDDLADGTFTISNGGVFGSLMSTPILNPPQSGILGLHKIEDRPMAVNGKIEIRSMMYVALSYDHRIVDGRESVSFLVKIKEGMEDPSRLLLDL